MADDRVDKMWQQRGLGPYSTEAIIGTLRHYGVTLDEGSFKQQAAEQYPLEIAQKWQPEWKGRGQFSRFHLAAAEELARRLFPDKLLPGDFAQPLVELIQALGGAAGASAAAAFEKVEALAPRLPLVAGKRDTAFVAEVRVRLGDWMKVLGNLAEDLAKKGRLEEAERFAKVEAFLFPEWEGASRALIRATKGEKEQALADLAGLVKDPHLGSSAKMAAIDTLIHLDALPQARDATLEILAEAEKGDDLHLALELGQRAVFLLEKLQDLDGIQKLIPRLKALHDRHNAEHHH